MPPTDVDAKQVIKFPDWAPRDLCDLYEREAIPCELTEKQRDALKALLKRRQMESVWGELRKAAQNDKVIAFHGGPLLWVEHNFAMAVCRAYSGPQGEECLTPRDQANHLEKVKKTARELASLVRGSSWDEWIFTKWDQAGLPRPKKGPIRQLSLPCYLQEFLEEFADFAESQMRASMLGRPKAEDAEELYFKRYLSAYCSSVLRDPCHSIVNAVALIFYYRVDTYLIAEQRTKGQVKATPLGPRDKEIKAGVAAAAAHDKEIQELFDDLYSKTKNRKR